jgi:hypothetical protein
MAATLLQVAGRRAHKLSSSYPRHRPIPCGAVQVTHAVAARYIVLWRVIRVVDRRALVIDFLVTF